jgi:hypothetical protein
VRGDRRFGLTDFRDDSLELFAALRTKLQLMQANEPNASAADLAAIGVPVEIVHAEHDEFITAEHARYLARAIPGTNFIWLPQVSHFAAWQNPALFSAELIKFLDTAAGRAPLKARCSCGRVEVELKGVPITSVVCYCDDCQAGARQIEALPGAPRVCAADGGTAYVAYRKDRVRAVKGVELLKVLKLGPTTPTNRVIASCCNSAMYLGFDDSKHWADIYRARIETGAPPPEMLICTKIAPDNSNMPDDIPGFGGYPPRFLAKLMWAKLAMVLGR